MQPSSLVATSCHNFCQESWKPFFGLQSTSQVRQALGTCVPAIQSHFSKCWGSRHKSAFLPTLLLLHSSPHLSLFPGEVVKQREGRGQLGGEKSLGSCEARQCRQNGKQGQHHLHLNVVIIINTQYALKHWKVSIFPWWIELNEIINKNKIKRGLNIRNPKKWLMPEMINMPAALIRSSHILYAYRVTT